MRWRQDDSLNNYLILSYCSQVDIQGLTDRIKESSKGNQDQELNGIASAKKELVDKQKALEEMERKLMKRKEKLDQMETKAQKVMVEPTLKLFFCIGYVFFNRIVIYEKYFLATSRCGTK